MFRNIRTRSAKQSHGPVWRLVSLSLQRRSRVLDDARPRGVDNPVYEISG